MASTFPEAAALVVDQFEPSARINVQWEGLPPLEDGRTHTPTQVQHQPEVTLLTHDGAELHSDKLYAILFTDPDAPTASDPKFGEWNHWIRINASAPSLTHTGEDLSAYVGSAPGKEGGVHRYIFVVYEQPGRIHPTEPVLPRARYVGCRGPRCVFQLLAGDGCALSSCSGFAARRLFKSREFAAKYGLRPVAAITFRASYDDLVPELHKRIQPPTE